MDEALKQKIVGVLVITAALIIFLPTIFDEPILEESLIKVDVSSKPGDLDITDFDELEIKRSKDLDKARQGVDAVRNTPSAEREVDTGTDGVTSPLREVVSSLVENIRDVTGKNNQPEESVPLEVWTIQLASFIKKENALKLRAALREQDEKAYIKEKKAAGGRVFRVYVGPMLREEDASAALQRLHQTHNLQGMIVRYVPE